MGRLKIRRLGHALGAEITGVDASKSLDDATVAELRKAWLDHQLICLPNQQLDLDQLGVFCRSFGELDVDHTGNLQHHPSQTGVVVVANKPVEIDGKRAGGTPPPRWHSDQSYKSRPAAITVLLSTDLPDVGGNTLFANMYMAYETLSPAYRRMIDPIEAIQDISLWRTYRGKDTPEMRALFAANPPTVHPLVRVHPETGRHAIFLGEDRVSNFVGMTPEETAPIVDFLNAHATRYEHTYRHTWRLHDLVMWDNRCLLHLAVPDYDKSQARRMMRCNVIAASDLPARELALTR